MDKLQRKMALKGFLESSGFRIFAEELGMHIDNSDAKKSERLKGFISAGGLDLLNFEIGKNSGLRTVLSILESFKEELKDTSSSDVKG